VKDEDEVGHNNASGTHSNLSTKIQHSATDTTTCVLVIDLMYRCGGLVIIEGTLPSKGIPTED
jgi:hypothetical protein